MYYFTIHIIIFLITIPVHNRNKIKLLRTFHGFWLHNGKNNRFREVGRGGSS